MCRPANQLATTVKRAFFSPPVGTTKSLFEPCATNLPLRYRLTLTPRGTATLTRKFFPDRTTLVTLTIDDGCVEPAEGAAGLAEGADGAAGADGADGVSTAGPSSVSGACPTSSSFAPATDCEDPVAGDSKESSDETVVGAR